MYIGQCLDALPIACTEHNRYSGGSHVLLFSHSAEEIMEIELTDLLEEIKNHYPGLWADVSEQYDYDDRIDVIAGYGFSYAECQRLLDYFLA